MQEGFVRLFRCSLYSRVWNNDGLWKVWCWCLMKANYKERWEGITTGKGKTEVHLCPGQFIFGRNSAAKDLKMKPPTVYDRMKKLVEIKNCTMESHTHYSIVTVCNWNKYQSTENLIHQPIHQPTINQPSTNHHRQEGKEGKEGKEVKIKSIGEKKSFFPPTIEEVAEYCLERNNTLDPERFCDHYTANGWVVGKAKAKMKDWRAAVRTWEKNGVKNTNRDGNQTKQHHKTGYAEEIVKNAIAKENGMGISEKLGSDLPSIQTTAR